MLETLLTALPFVALLAAGGYVFFVYHNRLVNAEEIRASLVLETSRLQAVIESSPDSFFCWNPENGREILPDQTARLFGLEPGGHSQALFDEILARFEPKSARALDVAVSALRQTGETFDLPSTGEILQTLLGQSLRVIGSRVSVHGDYPVDSLWFRDVTGETQVASGQSELTNVLSHERDRLRDILDHLPIAVWSRGEDMSLQYCNKAYGRAVEADPDMALAEGLEIGAGLIASQGRALAARALSTRTSQSESHHTVIEGSRRFLEFTETPVVDDGRGGEGAGGMIGCAQDFTELESIHNELARHIAAHDEVLENINIAISIFSPDKTLKFYNSAYARLWELEDTWLGSEPEIGEILDRLHEKRKLPEVADFRSFREGQSKLFTSLIDPREELVHLPDGTTLRALIAPHPFGGLIFTYEDVTDRLALERSYNTLIDVQQETLNNLYEGIAVFGNDGRLKLSNPAYAKIWALSPDILRTEPHIAVIAEQVHPFFEGEGEGLGEDWSQTKKKFLAPVADPTPMNGSFERNDGSMINYTCVPLPDGNVLLTFIDITDRFRVENALRERAEALETAADLKSEFLANVSYELRTPLNTILGFSEILSNQYFGPLTERQMEYSKGILDSSQRLLMLVNDILDLSTLEAGYLELDRESVDVRSVLNSSINLIREWTENRDLTLRYEFSEDIGTIYADARRVKQAVFNLLSNAVKFTLPGGEVILTAERFGDEVHITVTDSGIGITSADQKRVFDIFERGSDPSHQTGAGLGLALVKNLIDLHGGRVLLTSAPNEGTRVTIILPVNGEQLEQKTPLDVGNAAREGMEKEGALALEELEKDFLEPSSDSTPPSSRSTPEGKKANKTAKKKSPTSKSPTLKSSDSKSSDSKSPSAASRKKPDRK